MSAFPSTGSGQARRDNDRGYKPLLRDGEEGEQPP